MKREIKFRGKRIDNGEWIYGYYYQGREQSYILTNKAPHEKESSGLQPFKPYPVIPESVGQSIGLLDKNGKEIYEGDIYRYANDRPAVIEFEKGVFGYRIFNHVKPLFTGGTENKHEVIGNIYENKSLLK